MAPSHILLVEDEPALREIMAEVLGDEGYMVEEADNGTAALAAARARPPDLVVTDITMPKLDGFGLLRELRNDPRTGQVPVILLSGVAGVQRDAGQHDLTPEDVFMKPVDFDAFVARVKTLLDQAA